MNFHELSKLFPEMTDQELKELADDIKLNGQREPIVLYNGSILDGKNRYLACEIANVEPIYRMFDPETDGDVVSYVVSVNIQRRHLTAGQKAMLAAQASDIRKRLEEEAKARQGERTDLLQNSQNIKATLPQSSTRDLLAEMFDTSPRNVQNAKKILEKAPDLADRVTSNKMSIPKALKEITRREQATRLTTAIKQETQNYDIIYVDLPNSTTYERLDEIGYYIRETLSHENTMLFFWCPPSNLVDILDITKNSWRYSYRNCFVLEKEKSVQGKYFKSKHELLLVLSYGSPVYPVNPEELESVLRLESRDDFFEILKQSYPNMSIIRLDTIIGNIVSIKEDDDIEDDEYNEWKGIKVNVTEDSEYLDKYAEL